MIKIAIRLDDITEDMDWQKFLRFKGLLDLYGIKPLLGVVPDNKDDLLKISYDNAPLGDFWEYINTLQEDGYSIAMHGVNHVYTTNKGGLFPLNDFSEFAGLSFDEQLELLGYGVDIFNEKKIETDVFMAPGHSFDLNTIKALRRLGFSKITDGFGYNPYYYKGMTYYPISFKKSHTLNKNKGYSCLVYHVNTMEDSDFEEFENMLKNMELDDNSKTGYKIIDFSEYLDADVKDVTLIGRMMIKFKARLKHYLVKKMADKR